MAVKSRNLLDDTIYRRARGAIVGTLHDSRRARQSTGALGGASPVRSRHSAEPCRLSARSGPAPARSPLRILVHHRRPGLELRRHFPSRGHYRTPGRTGSRALDEVRCLREYRFLEHDLVEAACTAHPSLPRCRGEVRTRRASALRPGRRQLRPAPVPEPRPARALRAGGPHRPGRPGSGAHRISQSRLPCRWIARPARHPAIARARSRRAHRPVRADVVAPFIAECLRQRSHRGAPSPWSQPHRETARPIVRADRAGIGRCGLAGPAAADSVATRTSTLPGIPMRRHTSLLPTR